VTNSETCVLGLGHVGLPLAAVIASMDRKVLGMDSDPKVLSCLRKGEVPFYEVGLNELLQTPAVKANLKLTETWQEVKKSDTIIVTVGTPVTSAGQPVLNYIEDCTRSLGEVLRSSQLVIYRSTVPPGTLRNEIRPILEKTSGLTAGKDFYLAYCPERLVEGAALREIKTVPHIVGGVNDDSSDRAIQFFEELGSECIRVSKPEIAEMAKIMDNVYRDANIALANEFSLVCDEIGIDVMESIKAANTSPRTRILIPGCGVGGSCLNKDPYILIHSGGQNHDLSVVKGGRTTNESMPRIFAEFVANRLGHVQNRTLCLLGISFKGGTDDVRGTVTTSIAAILYEKGFRLKVFDPVVSSDVIRSLIPEAEVQISLREAFEDSAALVICSDHEEFKKMDYALIREVSGEGCLIVDGRNILDPVSVTNAGLIYLGFGRSFD